MKNVGLLLGCLVVAPFVANVQLTLNTGDTYVYHFDDLPLVSSGPFDPQQPAEGAEVLLSFSGGNFQTYKLELFEGLPEGEPVMQGSSSVNLPLALYQPGTWGDREGSIRVTAVAGPVTLSSVRISRFDPTPSSRDLYRAEFTPVPEPSTLALSFLGATALLLWKRK